MPTLSKGLLENYISVPAGYWFGAVRVDSLIADSITVLVTGLLADLTADLVTGLVADLIVGLVADLTVNLTVGLTAGLIKIWLWKY